MNIKFPEYSNCLTNLACSIEKEFGTDIGDNPTLQMCDRFLEKKYKIL